MARTVSSASSRVSSLSTNVAVATSKRSPEVDGDPGAHCLLAGEREHRTRLINPDHDGALTRGRDREGSGATAEVEDGLARPNRLENGFTHERIATEGDEVDPRIVEAREPFDSIREDHRHERHRVTSFDVRSERMGQTPQLPVVALNLTRNTVCRIRTQVPEPLEEAGYSLDLLAVWRSPDGHRRDHRRTPKDIGVHGYEHITPNLACSHRRQAARLTRQCACLGAWRSHPSPQLRQVAAHVRDWR
jgi:hypothetical protein